MKKIIITLTMSLIALTFFAQEDSDQFDFAYNGQWTASNVKIDPDIECLDVKNGTMASFKMILMLNNGANVKQFDMPGKCFSEKALEALKAAPAGTQIMFSQVKVVIENGGRIDASGKTYTVVE